MTSLVPSHQRTNHQSPHVWIVIVNYRTAELVIQCLHSISRQLNELPALRALVVDNASGDESVRKLTDLIEHQGWGNWAGVVAHERNGGFGAGCNIGIRQALQSEPVPKYVMLLNPDTVVHNGAIKTLVDFLDSHEGAGIAGSRLEDVDGQQARSAHKALSPLSELDAGARLGIFAQVLGTAMRATGARRCDWVSGASLIVRRQVFEEVGLLDEGFFLYFEEVDFCLRAQKAGWQVWFVPESRVVHLQGGATGIGNHSVRRPFYWYDSRRRYFVKHFGVAGLVLADTLWALGRASLLARRALGLGSGGTERDPKSFAFDLLWGDFRALLRRRYGR